jgi:DNA polymerase
MMNQITNNVMFVDFETRSPVDLMKAGLKRYAKDAGTEVLMMAWAIGNAPFQLWQQGQPVPAWVAEHVKRGGKVVAHNAQFELAIWNYIMAPRYGWPALAIEQCECTMSMCYAMALPGALDNAARALGLSIEKDTDGRALMLKMCKPYAWDGTTPLYQDTPVMRQRLGEYCIQDGEVERGIYTRLLPLSPVEQSIWALDQRINLSGIPFDMGAIAGALMIADAEKARLDDEMARVTGGAVRKCSAVGALKEWAEKNGVKAPSLAKAELAELLTDETLPDIVEEALRLRLASSRFTSISKLKAIQTRHHNGRVSYAFQYHAATTGRWGGRGVQPHNFTRDLPEPADVAVIMDALRREDVEALRAFGEPATVISRCLRGFICAPGGHELMGGDYSAVEGRGIAWLAGEEWKLAAYREIDANPNLADMYERSYAKAFGINPNDVTSAQRQTGKVMELAFGYQGGRGAFAKLASAGKILVVKEITPENTEKAKRLKFQLFTEAQVEQLKTQWRNAHVMIKSYWFELESAAIRAVQYPGEIFTAGPKGREVKFRVAGSFLWCRLPSRRMLCYPYPRLVPNDFKTALTFKGVPDDIVWATYATAKQDGKPNTTYIVEDPSNARAWCRIATYGGKLCENITQAICRDILAHAMLRVAKAGFTPVVHVHDELIVEGNNFDEEDRLAFELLMCEVPEWAEGFPIAAGCWRAPRYRKE